MENSFHKNLKLLWNLRNLAIIGQAIAIILTSNFLRVELKTLHFLEIIIGIMISINIITFYRIKTAKKISQFELFFQLTIDIIALYALLYFTGGASNPFTSLFILQVIIAAIALSPIYTWITSLIAICLYTLLMFKYHELPSLEHNHSGDFFNLHVQGMWVSFVLLTLIVAWFIVRINQTIRKQDSLLADISKVAAVGTIAAHAAHELGTPLTTLTLLAESYNKDLPKEEREHKAKIFLQELKRCKQIISNITATGGVLRAESGNLIEINNFIDNIIKSWQAKKTSTNLSINILNETNNLRIVAENTLIQSIHNLLDNASDSSPQQIELNISINNEYLNINIRDYGTGINNDIIDKIGQPGFTTKAHGMGMGLFLAKTVISRFNGKLVLKNHPKGGVITNLILPLKELSI